MDDKENDIIYNANDIQEYLAGKLTPLQMHAMEKAALDDPFLAEAMEGYGGMQQEEWKYQLAALKTEFAGEKNQAKVIALPRRKNNWWKVAVAVLILGSTAAVSYYVINKKERPNIAKNLPPLQKEVIQDSSKQLTSTLSTSENLAAITPSKSRIAESNYQYSTIDKNKGNAVQSGIIQSADSAFVYTPGKQEAKRADKQNTARVSDDNADKDKNTTAAAAVVPPTVSNNNTIAAEKITGENKYYNANAGRNGVVSQYQLQKNKTSADRDFVAGDLKKEMPLNRNFKAQVVGPDNSPLPFANISIKSENFGTYADAKGNFRLISSDSLLTVEVKAAGYQPRFYTLQSFVQQNKIVLAEEDAASRYKTISGNNSNFAKTKTSRRATLLKDSLVNVEPADGWDNYNTYVDNNIEIPDDILKKDIHGQVELSFDVSSNGTISNIKVDKSLCDNCDELAKRLIEQGPQWKVKKGKKGKGKVTVQF